MGKLSSAFENADTSDACPYSVMIFKIHSRVGNSFPNGGRTDFSENLRATLFNDDLWNATTFNQINFAGQVPSSIAE
jgi:hypothetical protein